MIVRILMLLQIAQPNDGQLAGRGVGQLFVGGDEVAVGVDGERDVERIVDGAFEGAGDLEGGLEQRRGRIGGETFVDDLVNGGVGQFSIAAAEPLRLPEDIGELGEEEIGDKEIDFGFGVTTQQTDGFLGQRLAHAEEPFRRNARVQHVGLQRARSSRSISSVEGPAAAAVMRAVRRWMRW